MVHSCDICFETFVENHRNPKVLDCGHTVCELCLTTLLQTQKVCPSCKVSLTKSATEYPTNFVLFKQLEGDNKITCISSHVVCSLKDLYNRFKTYKDVIVKDIAERNALKATTTYNMAKIEQTIDKDAFNVEEATKLLTELKLTCVELNSSLLCSCKTELKPLYSLSDYKSSKHLLFDLANKLHREEDVYVFGNIGNAQLKLGKISLDENKICVPTLSLSVTDVDKGDTIPGVPLQDLKKCLSNENFRTFIKIGETKLYFCVTDISYLALQFIKLCTGETGPRLKKALVEISYSRSKTVNIIIKSYMLNDCQEKGCIDYNLGVFSDEVESVHKAGEVIIEMLPSGLCEIRKCVDCEKLYKNVVAKLDVGSITDFDNVYTVQHRFVEECGIVFVL